MGLFVCIIAVERLLIARSKRAWLESYALHEAAWNMTFTMMSVCLSTFGFSGLLYASLYPWALTGLGPFGVSVRFLFCVSATMLFSFLFVFTVGNAFEVWWPGEGKR